MSTEPQRHGPRESADHAQPGGPHGHGHSGHDESSDHGDDGSHDGYGGHTGPGDHGRHEHHGRHENHSGHGDHGGHGGHGGHGDHAALFRDRFWVSLALTLPIVFYSHHIQMWFGYTAPAFPGSQFLVPVLGTAVFLYGGLPFLTGALSELRARAPGMMLLIGMAITVAFLASLSASLGLFQVEVWWELALLISIMLLGHWLEMRAIGQAQGALAALAALLPDEAERLGPDGAVETVPVAQLTVGDTVLVRPGARIPADGVVVQGGADVDESMITGESVPVHRTTGERVIAASVATDDSLHVQVDALGEETTLAGIQRMVAEAQASRSRTQVLADRAAALLFYAALIAAGITAAAWLLLGQTFGSYSTTRSRLSTSKMRPQSAMLLLLRRGSPLIDPSRTRPASAARHPAGVWSALCGAAHA
jgi:P-type Cu2+ transporter